MAEYTGIQTRPILTDLLNYTVTSMATNFDNSRIAVGTTADTGAVRIYDYNSVLNSWSGTVLFNGPSPGSGFGHSLDMDWSGNRVAVGANTVSQVYVYDFNGSTWSYGSNVINSPSGSASDFGFSVSISKDIPDTIAVGAPAHNNVHVYHIINDAWSEAFSNIGTDIENIAPIDTSGNNYVLKPEYNRYGESVRLSSLGNYLIVGQPGTILSELNSTNTVGLTGTVDVSSLQPFAGEYVTSFGVNLNRQQGSARVFKTEDSWLTSNTQVGSLLVPDINCVIGDGERTSYSVGWSFPGFGMQVDISSSGNIAVVSAPLFSVLGGDYTYHNGQIYTFIYIDDKWVKHDVFTGLKQCMFGISLKLDYTGERIAIAGSNRRLSLINVSDWNGNSWYGAQPDIIYPYNSQDDNKIYITNGEILSASIGKNVYFFNYLLTQSILGNNLIRGYIAADELYVGANDNDNDPSIRFSKTKRISFGGTYLDNSYEGTTIENRMYKQYIKSSGQGNEGRSELFISKTNQKIGTSESGGVDLVRLKAHEIHLDSHSLKDDYGNKYGHNPVLALNYQKNVGIGLPFLDDISGHPLDKFFRGTINTKAKLDVNGSMYVRNRINLNVDGGNDLMGNIAEQARILFDTRNGGSVIGNIISSNTMVDNILINIQGIINSPATYSVSERALDFTTGGTVTINPLQSRNANNLRISLWVKLTELPTSDNIVFRWASSTGSNPVDIYVTTSGFKVVVQTFIYTTPFTFTIGSWEHITIFYNRPSTLDVFINNQQPSVSQMTGTLPATLADENVITIGNGTAMYVGMVMIWSGRTGNGPTASMLYNNGPPTEMLKVGGDAVVTGKVGVGTTAPDYTLDVFGTSRFITSVGSVTRTLTLLDELGDSSFPGTVTTGNILQVGTNTNDSTAKTIFFGGLFGDNAYDHCVIENRIYEDTTENRELLLFSGNDGEGPSGPDRIRLRGANILFDTYSGPTQDRVDESIRMTIKGNGNVGIGTTAPGHLLHVQGNEYVSGVRISNAINSRDKLRVWSSSEYSIGMDNGYTFGALYSYAMTFQMYDHDSHGFWWGDTSHTNDQGSMSLTTDGQLTVATSVNVGYGENTQSGATDSSLSVKGVIRTDDVSSFYSSKFFIGTTWSYGNIENKTLGSGAAAFGTGGTTQWSIWETNAGGEASSIAINGDTIMMCSPADIHTLNYYDEDTRSLLWYITTGGVLVSASDIRFKTDISTETFGDDLDVFKQIRTVNYKLKKPASVTRETSKYDQVHHGVIAQELLELFPECVNIEDNGYYSVDYRSITLVTINALKKEIEKREALEAQLASVLTRLDALENTI